MNLKKSLLALSMSAVFGLGAAGYALAGARADSPSCVNAGGKASLGGSEDAEEFQRNIPRHPFFLKAAAVSPLQSCTIHVEPEGRLEIEYRFRDDLAVRVLSDPAIEYTALAATLRLAKGDRAESVLLKAERASYGDGCGLDMAHPETSAVKGEPGVSETVYQGSACNCRGAIRRDAKSKLTGFALSMAC